MRGHLGVAVFNLLAFARGWGYNLQNYEEHNPEQEFQSSLRTSQSTDNDYDLALIYNSSLVILRGKNYDITFNYNDEESKGYKVSSRKTKPSEESTKTKPHKGDKKLGRENNKKAQRNDEEYGAPRGAVKDPPPRKDAKHKSTESSDSDEDSDSSHMPHPGGVGSIGKVKNVVTSGIMTNEWNIKQKAQKYQSDEEEDETTEVEPKTKIKSKNYASDKEDESSEEFKKRKKKNTKKHKKYDSDEDEPSEEFEKLKNKKKNRKKHKKYDSDEDEPSEEMEKQKKKKKNRKKHKKYDSDEEYEPSEEIKVRKKKNRKKHKKYNSYEENESSEEIEKRKKRKKGKHGKKKHRHQTLHGDMEDQGSPVNGKVRNRVCILNARAEYCMT